MTGRDNNSGPGGGQDQQDSGSLRLYYRQLNDSEPLSGEEERALWEEMERNRQSVRDILFQFAFILPEHVKLYREASPESLGDVFSVASENSGTGAAIPYEALPSVRIPPWIAEIEALYREMKKAYAAGAADRLAELRERCAPLLTRYPVRPEKLYEWFHVAKVFLRSLSSSPDPEKKAGIEEKLFLPEEEFRRRMNDLEQAFASMEATRHQLLTANLRLVVSIVRPFRRDNIQTGDLIQEGNLGLIKALDRFNYRLGHKFSTYATWWIRQSVTKAIAAQSRIIRLPAHMLASISRINRAERHFIQETGRDPTADDLAKILEMPRERVNAIRKMTAQAISLQAPVSESPDAPTLEQILCEDEEDGPDRNLAFKLMRDRLTQALGILTEREQQIIRLRFGLAGKPEMTLVELSELFGLTRERVRQLEIRALRKLRDSKLSGDMFDYFS